METDFKHKIGVCVHSAQIRYIHLLCIAQTTCTEMRINNMASYRDRIKKKAEEKKTISLDDMTTPVEDLYFADKAKMDKITIGEEKKEEGDAKIKSQDDADDIIENDKDKADAAVNIPMVAEVHEVKAEEKSSDDEKAVEKQEKIDAINPVSFQTDDRRLSVSLDISVSDTSPWPTKIKKDDIVLYFYECYTQGKKKYQLINEIIKSEMEWTKRHPEFPDKATVMSNIANQKKATSEGYESFSPSILPECKEFLTVQSRKCGMRMFEYLEFLIEQYCS